jgi:hypothetical protein
MAADSGDKFFIDDPMILFTHPQLVPGGSMTSNEKLNALARLAIIVGIILYFMQYEHWAIFLIASILAIILLKVYYSKNKENFTLVPTYPNPDMQTTTVAPIFAEEQQIIPPAYDLYVNDAPDTSYMAPLIPQNYPYGVFMSKSNLLPSDEYASHMLNGGPKEAREYVNGAFIRHTLAHRDNMTRLMKKRLQRRFRQTTNDSFSPFHSY